MSFSNWKSQLIILQIEWVTVFTGLLDPDSGLGNANETFELHTMLDCYSHLKLRGAFLIRTSGWLMIDNLDHRKNTTDPFNEFNSPVSKPFSFE